MITIIITVVVVLYLTVNNIFTAKAFKPVHRITLILGREKDLRTTKTRILGNKTRTRSFCDIRHYLRRCQPLNVIDHASRNRWSVESPKGGASGDAVRSFSEHPPVILRAI